ncbi:MAG: chalcone isomerase family protein [Candidatus Auribacterota bacterium]|nr:chalcone isomerase family protein [Candidatus Auribacterota bacterium]
MKLKIYSLIVILISLSTTGLAAEVAGVNLPNAFPLNGETLVLNGAGLRTKTIFSIKVYAAGLYLREQNSDDDLK